MGLVKIISCGEFNTYYKTLTSFGEDEKVNSAVREIIAAVRAEGDTAVKRYAKLFDKEVPLNFEVPVETAKEAWENLKITEPDLADSLSLAADHIRRFSELQKEQLKDFETEIESGLFTGQRVIPIDKAAIYVPAGRFPLISSALMGLIPAATAKVREKILVSPPKDGGLPDKRILAAAHLAGADKIFAIGGAQAIAALALGTETIPKVDLIVGAGNKYVTAAKRLLFGEVGIDFIAGPTDVLIITEKITGKEDSANLIAADMIAQAEHDPDARARVLVPYKITAELIDNALERRLAKLSTAETARASLEAGGLIVIYESKEEAIKIANKIAPEHLELHVSPESVDEWTSGLRNYGSLFIGSLSAEVLGDYSAGINHVLPTSTSARFSGGLSVRHFLKTVTTLRCIRPSGLFADKKDIMGASAPDVVQGSGYAKAIDAAETIARAEGLEGHAESAALRAGKDKQ